MEKSEIKSDILDSMKNQETKELRWIDLLVLPQHREKEKDRLFQATKSGESREEMLHTGVEGLHIERVK